jgi:hypothetical protein
VQQRISCRARVNLASLNVCELRLTLPQCRTVSTVFLEVTSVLEAQRREALRDRDGRRGVRLRDGSSRGPSVR